MKLIHASCCFLIAIGCNGDPSPSKDCVVLDAEFERQVGDLVERLQNGVGITRLDSTTFYRMVDSLNQGSLNFRSYGNESQEFDLLERPKYLDQIGRCLEPSIGYDQARRVVDLDSSIVWLQYDSIMMEQLAAIHLYIDIIDRNLVPVDEL